MKNDEEIEEYAKSIENAIYDIKYSGEKLIKLHGYHKLSEENRKILLFITRDVLEDKLPEP